VRRHGVVPPFDAVPPAQQDAVLPAQQAEEPGR
jgi:hypothetical protein